MFFPFQSADFFCNVLFNMILMIGWNSFQYHESQWADCSSLSWRCFLKYHLTVIVSIESPSGFPASPVTGFVFLNVKLDLIYVKDRQCLSVLSNDFRFLYYFELLSVYEWHHMPFGVICFLNVSTKDKNDFVKHFLYIYIINSFWSLVYWYHVICLKINFWMIVFYMIQSSQSDLRAVDASAAALCFLGDTGPDVQLHLWAQSWILPLHAAEIYVSKYCFFKNHLDLTFFPLRKIRR